MNKARLIITAVTIEKLTQTEAARRYGLSQKRLNTLLPMKAREPVLGTIG